MILGLFLSIPLWGCEPTKSGDPPGSKELGAGGVYVAYNHGCEAGCDGVNKGDLIQEIDGKPVKTSKDFDDANLIDGKPHKLKLVAASGAPKEAEITAKPFTKMPPLENVPPFWAVGAAELDAAPKWARKRMFGHASPSVMLVNSDG
ncbi:MAG: PDZ domain-containing protein, partial [Myxococcota bacterium]